MEQEAEVEANEARGKPRVWFSKTHALKKKKKECLKKEWIINCLLSHVREETQI